MKSPCLRVFTSETRTFFHEHIIYILESISSLLSFILSPDVFFLLNVIYGYCPQLLLLSCLHLKIRNNAVPLAPYLPGHRSILSHLLLLHMFVDQHQFLVLPCLISYLFSLIDEYFLQGE